MTKITKQLLFNPAHILVSNVKCNFNNITKITNVFDCKWLMVTIDSLTEESPLLSSIREQGLKFFIIQRCSNYLEVSVVIPYNLFEDILSKAINEDPENIVVFNLHDPKKCKIFLQYYHNELVFKGIANMGLFIAFDENVMAIYVNKFLLNPRELCKKIKELQFE